MSIARRASAGLLGLVLLTGPLLAPRAGAEPEAQGGDPSGALAAWLARRVHQAESGQFYLVLDAGAPSLALALGGVTLLDLPVAGVTVHTPRVLYRRAAAPRGWQDATWIHGVLDPPLPVASVVPPPDGDTETAGAPPPLPDELVPAPGVFDIHFEGGLGLRVVTVDDGVARTRGWAAAARERWRVLRGEAPDAVRVQLLMAPADAGRLYRALPPETSLIMTPLVTAPPET